ncbi:MAG: A/G-specific adenine glycosylase [Elusimicrobia bacterium]|nr:A/G-specific adenine glycosylase [Elusimicrobiota bacterium]
MSDAALRRRLLAWYDAHRRPLPWRSSKDPYRVWLSEIMLQQTTVAAVIPYYERFLSRFPDVRALASADEDEVLRLWAGLGYYSRARNLLAAAREVARRGGAFPEDPEGLRALPGVGRYTAGAVASIAFSKKTPLVDGNVARVFARLFAMRGDPKSPAFQKRAWARADALVDARRPGDWNQALMELGATVCLPALPSCPSCPLAPACRAKALGLQESLPRQTERKAPVPLRWTALVVRDGGRLLLWRRDAHERLLPGHWGLPEARHLPGTAPGRLLGRLTHSITHHRISVSIHEAERPARLPPAARWTTPREAREMLVSSLWRKALDSAA